MIFKKKALTDTDFDPASVGFVFDPNFSVAQSIEKLVRNFNKTTPGGHIGAIMLDAVSYWQLKEELAGGTRVRDGGEVRFLGYPVYLMGIEGVGLCLKTSLAPALLTQQLEHQARQKELLSDALRRFGELMPEEEELQEAQGKDESKTVH